MSDNHSAQEDKVRKKSREVKILRQLRLEAGLSQKDLGDYLNLDGSMLSCYESGRRYPRRLHDVIVYLLSDNSVERIIQEIINDAVKVVNSRRKRKKKWRERLNLPEWRKMKHARVRPTARRPFCAEIIGGDDWESNPRHREKVYSLGAGVPKRRLNL